MSPIEPSGRSLVGTAHRVAGADVLDDGDIALARDSQDPVHIASLPQVHGHDRASYA